VGLKHRLLKNWISNVSRLVFNFPYSYTQQSIRSCIYVIPNGFILATLATIFVCLRPPIALFRPEMLFLAVFLASALFGISLLSSLARMYTVFTPILFIFTVYSYHAASPKWNP